jgi:predicted acyl esterase
MSKLKRLTIFRYALSASLILPAVAVWAAIRNAEGLPPGSDEAWDVETDPPPQWENRPYRRTTRSSQYLKMRDGVRLAVDLYLPEGLAPETRIPALLCQTRYYRDAELRWPFSTFMRAPRLVFPEPFVTQGYAFVLVDVRGSGASFGYRASEFSADELADAVEILDWIVRQPWSDGKVGGYGASYMGTAAELLLATRHPAVKAIATISSPYDLYLDVALPGGILWTEFLRDWGLANQALDSNRAPKKFGFLTSLGLKGVRPVEADSSGELLQAAL